MVDPFKITGPAVVSFSGGETSGMMLKGIVDAHGGTLPSDVLVCFQNTGKERPETLDFVERCACEWGVKVVWLEYRHEGKGKPSFAVVDYAAASRNGEPFETAIRTRSGGSGYLPNLMTRYCTIDLKLKTLHRYLRSLGWESWTNCIGFRADEPQRVAKARGRGDGREDPVFPLHAAGIAKPYVKAWWSRQPFRLELGPDEGNCDLCFLKGSGKLERIMRDRPDLAAWWVRMEAVTGNRFRNDRPSYAALLERSQRASLPMMGDDEPDHLSIACHCTD